MSFLTKMWKNRSVEYPNRFTIKVVDEENGIYDITRLEGKVSEEGDALDAENFNDQEERIGEAINSVESELDERVSMLHKECGQISEMAISLSKDLQDEIASERNERLKSDARNYNDLIARIQRIDRDLDELENRVRRLENK